MAGTLREGGGGSNMSNSSNYSSSSSSSTSSTSSSCTRIAPGSVIAVSPSHALDYDCTDCGSFLFGHRGRLRPRTHSLRNHHHSRVTSLSEAAQADAQRLLIVGSTPPHHPFASSVPQHLILPQSEQLSSLQQAMDMEEPCDFLNTTTGIANDVSNDVSDPGSLQGSDEEEEVIGADGVMSFVACHGAEPAMVGNAGDAASTLAEIFRCFICLGKVVDAQLCPCCSKLVCQPCIKRWLTDQKSECPHCRAPLLVSQLVSCRFISEISVEVERIQGKFGDNPLEKYCPTHDSPLLYFCTTCSVAVCSDCAVLIEDHRNHTFEKLSVAYGRHKKKIRIEAAGLRRRRKELCALVASVDKNIESVLKSKDESSAELQVVFKRMQSRLEDQLKCKLLALLAQKGSMTQEMELLDTILHELDQQLNSIPKSDLIAQEPNMSRMLQDIRTRTFSDISRTPIPADFISEVVPSYEYGELILKNYKSNLSQNRPTSFCLGDNQSPRDILLSKAVVYSEPIGASGVAWRLKVYPNGSGASQGTHLSVFLEMVEGGNEAATYEYGIELLHRNRPNQRIVRKFSSDFEAGACWGYYQFFRIDLLEKEGYLLPEEDTITLRFYVRPLTYQQQCQDLRRALAALQAERDESATQVAVIRRAFAATFFQRRRRRSSRAAAVHADGQVSFAQAVSGMSNVTSPALSTRKSHMPSIKHFHMKMQEYGGTKVGKWLPGMWPQVERINMNSEVSRPGDQLQNSLEIPSGSPLDHATHPSGDAHTEFSMRSEDMDVPAGSSQRTMTTIEYNATKSTTPPVHARGKERQEHWMKKRDDFFQLPPPKSRSHKKLRSRKTHQFLALPAPEVPEVPEAPLPFTDPLQLARHLSALSIKAGPSVSTKKILSTPIETTSAAPVEPTNSMNGGNIINETPREKSAHEFLDSETVSTCGLPPSQVVMRNLESRGVDWSLENKYTTFYSSTSGVGGSFCTPEIEDWGNLK